jgi:uncharacterized protein YggU (UPF0235/DUF167 family)
MRIHVVAHPKAKHPKTVKTAEGVLHIYVSAAPEDGKANEAVRAALAQYLDVGVSRIALVRGAKSRHKEFVVKE